MKEPIVDILQSSVWASTMMCISNITLKWLLCASPLSTQPPICMQACLIRPLLPLGQMVDITTVLSTLSDCVRLSMFISHGTIFRLSRHSSCIGSISTDTKKHLVSLCFGKSHLL